MSSLHTTLTALKKHGLKQYVHEKSGTIVWSTSNLAEYSDDFEPIID